MAKLNPSNVYRRAEERFAGTQGVTSLSLLKSIYSLTSRLDGDNLDKRAMATQRQYIDKGRIYKYTTKIGDHRYEINDREEYKLIADMISFIQNDIVTRPKFKSKEPKKVYGRKKVVGKKRVRRGIEGRVVLTSSSEDIMKIFGYNDREKYEAAVDKIFRSDQYFRHIHKLVNSAYQAEAEELEGLDGKLRLKVGLVDSIAVKGFARKIAKQYEAYFKNRSLITDNCNFQDNSSAKKAIGAIVSLHVPDLFEHIKISRKKAKVKIPRRKTVYHLMEDDVIGVESEFY